MEWNDTLRGLQLALKLHAAAKQPLGQWVNTWVPLYGQFEQPRPASTHKVRLF